MKGFGGGAGVGEGDRDQGVRGLGARLIDQHFCNTFITIEGV